MDWVSKAKRLAHHLFNPRTVNELSTAVKLKTSIADATELVNRVENFV